MKRKSEARRTERQKKGSLADLAVDKGTLERYQQTLWNFFHFLDEFGKTLPSTTWGLDEEPSSYVEELWAAGHGLSQAQYTLASVHHFVPQLRGRISGAWRKLKTWRRHEVPRRAPPIPPIVVRGIAGLARIQGRLDVSVGILIGFQCMLRGGEILRLKICDCIHFHDTVVLNLGFTKAGLRKGSQEQVTITDKSLASLLKCFSRNRSSTATLVSLSPCNFRKYFFAPFVVFRSRSRRVHCAFSETWWRH